MNQVNRFENRGRQTQAFSQRGFLKDGELESSVARVGLEGYHD
jgi:hypothetical protein